MDIFGSKGLNTFLNPLADSKEVLNAPWAPKGDSPWSNLAFHAAALAGTYGLGAYGIRKLILMLHSKDNRKFDRELQGLIDAKQVLATPELVDTGISDREAQRLGLPKAINTTASELNKQALDGNTGSSGLGAAQFMSYLVPSLAVVLAARGGYAIANKEEANIRSKSLSKKIERLESDYDAVQYRRLEDAAKEKGGTLKEAGLLNTSIKLLTPAALVAAGSAPIWTPKVAAKLAEKPLEVSMAATALLAGAAGVGSFVIANNYLKTMDPAERQRKALIDEAADQLKVSSPPTVHMLLPKDISAVLNKPGSAPKKKPVIHTIPTGSVDQSDPLAPMLSNT